MKKTVMLLAALLFIFFVLPAAAGPGDALLLTSEQCIELGLGSLSAGTSMTAIGDTLYLMTGSSIVTWKAGVGKPTLAASGLPVYNWYDSDEQARESLGGQLPYALRYLFSWEDKLYGLNSFTGIVYPLTLQGGKAIFGEPVKLAWENMTDQQTYGSSYQYPLLRLAAADGKLYMLMRGFDDAYEKTTLISFDLKTGVKQTFPIEHVLDFTPYRDGKLIVEIHDQATAFDEEEGIWHKPSLAVWNPETNQMTEAKEMDWSPAYGIVYNEANDTLYFSTIYQIRMMPSLGASQQAAYLPLDYSGESSNSLMLDGGLYAFAFWNGVYVRNADPQYLPTKTLSLYGMYANNAYNAYTASHPDVAVSINQDVWFESPEALAKAMVSGDNAFDIYQLDLSYDGFSSLLEEGYCADLTDLGTIGKEVSKMYPFLQEAVQKEGRVYAVPMEIYGYGLSYSRTGWEESGIPLEKIPQTFLEYLEFAAWWAEEGKEVYPGYQLLDGISDYQSTLLDNTIELYLQHFQAIGEDETFDTPLFLKLMKAYESIDFEKLNLKAESDEDFGRRYETPALFTPYSDWLNAYHQVDSSDIPLPLPLDEGLPVLVAANVRISFVNPNSKYIDLAVDYLETQLNVMERSAHILLFPNDNEPEPETHFEEMIESWERELTSLEESLATAPPESKKDIQSMLETYQDLLGHKEDFYWIVSAKSIAAYREIAKNAFALKDNILNYQNQEGVSELRSLMDRYQNGQLPLQQFIQEMEKKIRMIQLERK